MFIQYHRYKILPLLQQDHFHSVWDFSPIDQGCTNLVAFISFFLLLKASKDFASWKTFREQWLLLQSSPSWTTSAIAPSPCRPEWYHCAKEIKAFNLSFTNDLICFSHRSARSLLVSGLERLLSSFSLNPTFSQHSGINQCICGQIHLINTYYLKKQHCVTTHNLPENILIWCLFKILQQDLYNLYSHCNVVTLRLKPVMQTRLRLFF